MENFQLNDDTLKDEIVIPLFSNGSILLSFLYHKTKEKIQVNLTNFFKNETVNKYEKDKLENEGKKILEVWKNLLIYSINFLKINDFRERSFIKNISKKHDNNNKTTIDNEDALKDAPLNAYGIEDLGRYFHQFTKFESTLYGADINYRDHIKHPFRVWLIGLKILEEYGKTFRLRANKENIHIENCDSAKPKWGYYPEDKNKKDLKISLAELGAMWTIVALTHDLGYPLERVDKINEKLENMINEFGKIDFTPSSFTFQAQHDHLVRLLLKIISSTVHCKNNIGWYTHLSPKYHAKFSRSWELFEHGIVSSLILLRSLNYFLETDLLLDQNNNLKVEDARQFAIRSDILHSIAAHTNSKVYHTSANTLSFLLILCDELQVWNRPTLTDIIARDIVNKDLKAKFSCNISEKKGKLWCEFICKITLEKIGNDQEKYVKEVFKKWHERLRPAVFDTDRHMNFKWIIEYQKDNKDEYDEWSFELDTSKQVFKQFSIIDPSGEPFKIY